MVCNLNICEKNKQIPCTVIVMWKYENELTLKIHSKQSRSKPKFSSILLKLFCDKQTSGSQAVTQIFKLLLSDLIMICSESRS